MSDSISVTRTLIYTGTPEWVERMLSSAHVKPERPLHLQDHSILDIPSASIVELPPKFDSFAAEAKFQAARNLRVAFESSLPVSSARSSPVAESDTPSD